MKLLKYGCLSLWFVCCLSVITGCDKREECNDFTCYVNPFIGTSGVGHCFPGAALPFGMIQASPVTGNSTWAYSSGYQYNDRLIHGFAQTHLNGTGCTDLGDILLLPFTTESRRDDFLAPVDKEREKARPGYYQTYLPDACVNAQITATEHVAFHKYTYENDNAGKLLVDLQFGYVSDLANLPRRVLEFENNIGNNYIITGSLRTSHWVERDVYFVIEFNQPFVRKSVLPVLDERQKADRYVLDFDLPDDGVLLTKVALSTVSINNAKLNMAAELPGWEFDEVCSDATAKWNQLLSRVKIEGSREEKENFYTSMYHLFLQPSNIADVNGDYRGADNQIANMPSGHYYSTFSLWDTYRAAHPLYTILTPEYIDHFVESMLCHFKAQGYLPIWTLWGKENHTMIANHSIPVIVDAYLKGFEGFDPKEAFEAIYRSLTENHEKSDWGMYDTYGYYPFDLQRTESVSRTLESVYDDYCAYQMAVGLGRQEAAELFAKRMDYYKNLLDPETRILRPKDSKGAWRDPFSPLANAHDGTLGGDYTEGNGWQYTWHVQHDLPGLIDGMGGKESFIEMLDRLFTMENEGDGHVLDITGLVGQYAHGNEPSHHVAYLYTLAGKASKTQELVRHIIRTYYKNTPDGLCGNDDCGQMSAWYLFSCMGFYPVNPCGGTYILGAPQLSDIQLDLPGGKTFRVVAENLSEENKYVQQVRLNGKPYSQPDIQHRDIINGGELYFLMGSTPVNNYFE
ncbi:GH92 family glycosyl hydrolase [Parabacteroides sp. OttesenSCG-928-N08]|nr:GH92 family glycosyl hydrolase [Parabacteroides sp. OttesenSCG-928-N08]